jgi:hypothetical protein
MNGNIYMISFGIVEIFFSQIPDFDQLWWLSALAAVMSFTYSTIGLGLGIGKVIGMNDSIHIHVINKPLLPTLYFAFAWIYKKRCFKNQTELDGSTS